MSIFDYANVVEHLRAALSTPLPGATAQVLMASRPRRPGWETDPGRVPRDTRNAAVLLLIYPKDDKAFFALTRRTENLESHSSQISLPGGAMEAGETPLDGALREAREEIGLDSDHVEILGHLTPLHVPVSGFLIHPVVATMASPPRLRRDPAEVAEILEAPIERLLEPQTITWSLMDRPRGKLLVPFFTLKGCDVWGATAMILSELITIMGWQGPSEPPDEKLPD